MIRWLIRHLERPPWFCLCHVFGWAEWSRVMLIRALRELLTSDVS